ncbi:conserved hypothetical protein [Nitrobacter hamburgensis X14]|uniref:Uncharacterized protein n=1 Tax=Nitrobacter hamburgensis (strain DSM 10229 / NCIMB 13809 / X14) TaxID=323097 RepID=Q1QNM2_NITHX|nr:hypothetical protein [Nitrobacter hamburgensis]ABE62175.1 conserved hypothetical protein [Nitrobacter hamburgensis X14]
MPMPVEPLVRTALAPFDKRVRRVVDIGFKAYLSRRGAGNLYKRTDAAEIFDCVVQAAIVEFDDKPGVKVFKGKATARFLFANTVLVRFKKADRSGAGQNVRTGANDRFLNPTLAFPDAPEAMKVEICWKLNAMRTGYDSLHVTSRNGAGVLWSYELLGGVQETIRFPSKPAPMPATGRRRAKLKSEDAKKKSRDAS